MRRVLIATPPRFDSAFPDTPSERTSGPAWPSVRSPPLKPMLSGARPRGKPDVRSPKRAGCCRLPEATADDRVPPVEHVGARVHAPRGCERAAPGCDPDPRTAAGLGAKSPGIAGSALRRLPIGGGDPATVLDDRRWATGRRRDGRSCAAPDANVSAGGRFVRGIAQTICVIPQGHWVV